MTASRATEQACADNIFAEFRQALLVAGNAATVLDHSDWSVSGG